MTRGHARGTEPDMETLLAVGVLAVALLGVGGVLVTRLLARLHAGKQTPWGLALHAAGRPLLILLLASAALALVAVALRVVCTRRTLRSRVAYAVLPPPTFDPQPEAIEAFAQQLLGARRRVLAWLDRPATGVRIRLTSTADGRLLYVVELPARFRGTLFNAYATAYPQVDLRPLEEIAGPPPAAAEPAATVLTLPALPEPREESA